MILCSKPSKSGEFQPFFQNFIKNFVLGCDRKCDMVWPCCGLKLCPKHASKTYHVVAEKNEFWKFVDSSSFNKNNFHHFIRLSLEFVEHFRFENCFSILQIRSSSTRSAAMLVAISPTPTTAALVRHKIENRKIYFWLTEIVNTNRKYSNSKRVLCLN